LSPGSQRTAYLSLAAVCFFWGTTYLAIRVALEGIPPLLLVSSRFLLSGGLIFLYGWLRRWPLPTMAQLRWPIFTGLLTLGLGNYCLTLAETYIASGLAALFITVGPFWMVGMEAAISGGERFRPKALWGMLVGFSGAIWLVGPEALDSGLGGNTVKGFVILQLSCLGWSLGSVLQKRSKSALNPVMIGAIQQFAVGVVFLFLATADTSLRGSLWEIPTWNLHLTPRVAGAVLYLALFGSIVAYSSYLYALHHLPMAVVSIYTYINPVVAVTLGSLLYAEAFGFRELSAMLVIFLGVWLIKKIS
jgi:drug/metabolite transporter (DMT)-like permease